MDWGGDPAALCIASDASLVVVAAGGLFSARPYNCRTEPQVMDDEDIEETDFIEAILGKCWGGLDDPMMSIKNNAVLIAVHRQTLADYRSYFQLVVISLLLSVLVRQILQR